MSFKGKSAHGGARKGAGAKPKAFTLLKRRIESEKKDDAEYAYTLYASVMRDSNQSLDLRLDCADWIANRVLGKPKEDITHHGAIPVNSIDYTKAIADLKPKDE